MPCSIQDLSSPTRAGSCAPCIRSSVLTTGSPGMSWHQGFLYLPCQEFMHILHPHFLVPHALYTPSHPRTHPWPDCNISQGKDNYHCSSRYPGLGRTARAPVSLFAGGLLRSMHVWPQAFCRPGILIVKVTQDKLEIVLNILPRMWSRHMGSE